MNFCAFWRVLFVTHVGHHCTGTAVILEDVDYRFIQKNRALCKLLKE